VALIIWTARLSTEAFDGAHTIILGGDLPELVLEHICFIVKEMTLDFPVPGGP